MLSHTATEARANFFQIIKRSLTLHEPQRISSPAGSVVVMSEEDYDSLQETLYLQSQPGWQDAFAESKAEADRGETQSFADVFGEELE
jgi:antitoxin YefM